ncbi:MAG: SDR family NAD(P)-dependent oxidoreductase, partial [Jatrophihabitantaceae bacterium]
MTGQPPVAVITGAGRGIGAATALLLARLGWQVLAIDLAADDPSLPYPLASRAQLDRLAADAAAETGRPSIEVAVADVRDAGLLSEL